MIKYTTLFIDLDGTVFDFLKSENKAVRVALKMNNLPCDGETAKLYSKINDFYWKKFENGEIARQDIFENRFIKLLKEIGRTGDTKKLSNDYFSELANYHDLKENAEYVLCELKKRGYFLCAATNGVSRTQHKRIIQSGIDKYFDVVCVSEEVGCQKPQKEYFDYIISKCQEKDKSKILMIGDRESSDVLGALNSGIDICWFNENKLKGKYKVNYEIEKLTELLDIL